MPMLPNCVPSTTRINHHGEYDDMIGSIKKKKVRRDRYRSGYVAPKVTLLQTASQCLFLLVYYTGAKRNEEKKNRALQEMKTTLNTCTQNSGEQAQASDKDIQSGGAWFLSHTKPANVNSRFTKELPSAS